MGESNILISKLAVIQKTLVVPKNQYNSFGKYKYRSCEDILNALKSLMKDNEAVTLTDDVVVVGDRVYVKAIATYSYEGGSISAEAFAREPITQKGMSDSQITGTASSYARKYALNGLFMIDDTKDADHNSNSGNSDADMYNDAIDGLKNIDELKKYYEDNKDKVKDKAVFNKLINKRKGELANDKS